MLRRFQKRAISSTEHALKLVPPHNGPRAETSLIYKQGERETHVSLLEHHAHEKPLSSSCGRYAASSRCGRYRENAQLGRCWSYGSMYPINCAQRACCGCTVIEAILRCKVTRPDATKALDTLNKPRAIVNGASLARKNAWNYHLSPDSRQ